MKNIVVCTPPSKYGRSDLVLAACQELGLTQVIRAGGAAAIAALAFGTKLIPRVDKIVGPGNIYVQLAKRALAGCVGIDGFLGPSRFSFWPMKPAGRILSPPTCWPRPSTIRAAGFC